VNQRQRCPPNPAPPLVDCAALVHPTMSRGRNRDQGPAEYPWSSDRHHALGAPNGILSPHELYMALGNSAVARQLAYRELFVTGFAVEPGIDDAAASRRVQSGLAFTHG